MQWRILQDNGEKVPAKCNVIFRQKNNTRSAVVEFTHSDWKKQIAQQFMLPFYQIEFLDESPTPVPEDIGNAAREYADANSDSKWNKAAELERAFLAGAAHGQQVFAGYPSKGGILSKKLGVESHKVLDEEKRQSVFAAMDEYAFYYHDEKLKSSSQPLPSNIAEALEKLNPQNSDGTDTKWYEYYGSQVQGEGKESFVHSATCYLACKMAEQELFQKIKELLSVQPVQGNAEDQEALWNEIKSKFFLTNMLNPKWTEEFIQQYTIKKK